MEIKVGDRVEYRSQVGLLETMLIESFSSFGGMTWMQGQGRSVKVTRVTQVLETAS